VTLRVTFVGTAHIEAKSYSGKAVPNKHCCDNSKRVSTEILFLDKHSVAWLNLRYMTMQLSLLRNDWKRVPIEVVQQNRVTRRRDKVFSTRAESSYLRRTDKGVTSTQIEMDTMQYYRQAANIWRHALISSGNSRAAYMTEHRKRKRLEEDNCNNASKWTKLHTERQRKYRVWVSCLHLGKLCHSVKR
jgi:hypothetical protein